MKTLGDVAFPAYHYTNTAWESPMPFRHCLDDNVSLSKSDPHLASPRSCRLRLPPIIQSLGTPALNYNRLSPHPTTPQPAIEKTACKSSTSSSTPPTRSARPPWSSAR